MLQVIGFFRGGSSPRLARQSAALTQPPTGWGPRPPRRPLKACRERRWICFVFFSLPRPNAYSYIYIDTCKAFARRSRSFAPSAEEGVSAASRRNKTRYSSSVAYIYIYIYIYMYI